MIIYGHRGARGEAPENTLAGFHHAMRQGIRHFEMDIQLSRDGEPVVVHDLTVDRTTRQTGEVCNFTAKALSLMDARCNSAPWLQKTGIPRLSEVIACLQGYEHLQLEVKPDNPKRLNILCNRLVELIQLHKDYARITLTSSDTSFLHEVNRRDPDISTGLVAERRFPNPLTTASRLHCDHLILNWKLCSASSVKAAHQAGIKVSVWTVNRIQDMIELTEKGVDSIITDYPSSAQHYFLQQSAKLGILN